MGSPDTPHLAAVYQPGMTVDDCLCSRCGGRTNGCSRRSLSSLSLITAPVIGRANRIKDDAFKARWDKFVLAKGKEDENDA